ncbi:MAG: hypothetical protein P0Y66_22650 [Candidatus Kaistia colombiensis]|nr:MAG: hypothetical protein P0Y66_22650 [Kaistia sp.]
MNWRATRSAWIEYDSHEALHVNLDGEPVKTRHFRAGCHHASLRVHLGGTPLNGTA